MLTAADDPFVSGQDYEEAELSPSIVLHIEKCGGHMGYLAQSGMGHKRWLDGTLRTYLQLMCLHQHK
jgi:predicted alpha/beta-fold hydrolase